MMNGALHFDVSGTGTIPVICIHGWGCEGAQFIELSRALGPKFRVYRPDLPGHGRTPLDGFVPSFANYADVIVDFALGQQLENPILIGHSLGGALATRAAAPRLQPRAVIQLDGILPPAAQTVVWLAMIRSWLDEPDFRDRLAMALRENFFLPQERDARCEAIIRMMCSAPAAVLRYLPEQIGSQAATNLLPKVSAPILYIAAAVPFFDVPKVAKAQIRVEQIPTAGHFLHVYAFDQVAAKVEEFLRPAAG